jgi:hypothetical protein
VEAVKLAERACKLTNYKNPYTMDTLAAAYASGVRLFAFKSKKKELSCAELQAGKREADAGPAILRAPGNGLSHSQVSRGVILAHEVSRELGREIERRCGKG